MDKHAHSSDERVSPGEAEQHAHAHEHPTLFTPLRVVDDRVVAVIREALSESGAHEDVVTALDNLVAIIDSIEFAAAVARAVADHVATPPILLTHAVQEIDAAHAALVGSVACPPADGAGAHVAHDAARPSQGLPAEHGHSHGDGHDSEPVAKTAPDTAHDPAHARADGDAPEWSQIFSRAPIVDLLVGLSYASTDPAEMRRVMRPVTAALAVAARKLESAGRAAAAPSGSPSTRASITALALKSDAGPHCPRAVAFTDSVEDLVERWIQDNPIDSLKERGKRLGLNDRIARVEPSCARAGDKVAVVARRDCEGGFGKRQPPGCVAMGEDGRTVFPIRQWDSSQVVVEVPPAATSGHLFFAADGLRGAADLAEWEKLLEHEWWMTALPTLTRGGLRRPALCDPAAKSHLNILARSRFGSVRLVAAGDKSIESPLDLADARAPVEVRWECVPAVPGASVELRIDGHLVQRVAAALGRVEIPRGLDSVEQLELTELRVYSARRGGGDDDRWSPPDAARPDDSTPVLPERFPDFAALTMHPGVLSLTVPARQDERRRGPDRGVPAMRCVDVRFPLRLRAPVRLTVQSDSDRVEVVGPDPVAAGENTTSVLILAWAYDRDNPEQPCANVSVSAHIGGTIYEGTVEVWVAPREGKWELVGPTGPDVERISGNRSELIEGRYPAGRIGGQRLELAVGVHAVLLDDGTMLFFAPPRLDIGNQAAVETERWNPMARASLGADPPPAASGPRNLFCAGHCHLPDGRILIAGGHAVPPLGSGATDRTLHVYDPRLPADRGRTRWNRLADMTEARWYPTCTVLPDGRVLIVSGAAGGAYAPVVEPVSGSVLATPFGWSGDTARVTDAAPAAGVLGLLGAIGGAVVAGIGRLSGGSATSIDVFDPREDRVLRFRDADFLGSFHDTYPYMAILPSGPGYPAGAVLAIERDNLHLFAYQPTSARSPLSAPVTRRLLFRARRTFPKYGSGVLLPIDATNPNRVRYLVLGGGDERNSHLSRTSEATDTAEIIDFDPRRTLNDSAQAIRRARRMTHRRFMSDAVLLADGNVLVCGGAARGITNLNSQPVRQAELFDSTAETFQPVDTAAVERRYHSTHVLLLDGTVQATGSTGDYPIETAGGPPPEIEVQLRVELYRPSYLWKGPRPTISSAPATLRYGVSTEISTHDAARIARAALIKLASVTHANNMDQRYVHMTITHRVSSNPARATDNIVVSTPRDGTIAPPGPYMLVLIDNLGVPSHGRVVSVTA